MSKYYKWGLFYHYVIMHYLFYLYTVQHKSVLFVNSIKFSYNNRACNLFFT